MLPLIYGAKCNNKYGLFAVTLPPLLHIDEFLT
jgi:hypothetical protein